MGIVTARPGSGQSFQPQRVGGPEPRRNGPQGRGGLKALSEGRTYIEPWRSGTGREVGSGWLQEGDRTWSSGAE